MRANLYDVALYIAVQRQYFIRMQVMQEIICECKIQWAKEHDGEPLFEEQLYTGKPYGYHIPDLEEFRDSNDFRLVDISMLDRLGNEDRLDDEVRNLVDRVCDDNECIMTLEAQYIADTPYDDWFPSEEMEAHPIDDEDLCYLG